jgi:hypothetical protein
MTDVLGGATGNTNCRIMPAYQRNDAPSNLLSNLQQVDEDISSASLSSYQIELLAEARAAAVRLEGALGNDHTFHLILELRTTRAHHFAASTASAVVIVTPVVSRSLLCMRGANSFAGMEDPRILVSKGLALAHVYSKSELTTFLPPDPPVHSRAATLVQKTPSQLRAASAFQHVSGLSEPSTAWARRLPAWDQCEIMVPCSARFTAPVNTAAQQNRPSANLKLKLNDEQLSRLAAFALYLNEATDAKVAEIYRGIERSVRRAGFLAGRCTMKTYYPALRPPWLTC